jgi:SAM-dependent methyltransferase
VKCATIPPSLLDIISSTLASCSGTIYTETRSEFHDSVTRKVWGWVKELVDIGTHGGPILDVGCGMGVALEMFQSEGLSCIGVTANKEEFDACLKAGLTAINWEFHSISELPGLASGIWLRHAAEHSFMPLVLLKSCHAALRDGGWIYIEVPAPGTAAEHESNPNHFSVMGEGMWRALIGRAGFLMLGETSIGFRIEPGDEKYLCFLAKKTA